MISARRQFLDAFLGALGAAEIVDYQEDPAGVRGTVRYAEDAELLDLSGHADDEFQDFAWPITEEQAPPLLVYQIADVLHRYQLVHVDRMRVSRETLREILEQDLEQPVDPAEFAVAVSILGVIAVPMLEDGVATADAFRIREA